MAVEGYDLVMLGILAVAALLGYFKGMVWQLAWIAGIFAIASIYRIDISVRYISHTNPREGGRCALT